MGKFPLNSVTLHKNHTDMRYQAYIISDKGVDIKVVNADSESEAMNIIFASTPESAVLRSIRPLQA